MTGNKNNQRAICVLGTHRSGTSTITRGLNLLGAYLGEEKDLMKPLPENPEGFWERLDIYYLQNRLLSIMKRDWAATAPLPENWHKADEIRTFKDELVALVKENFSSQPLWLWKDPRTCLLLPLWKNVLSELGIDLKVLFVVRNPLDVARSLEKRNGFTTDKGLGIWFNHTIAALHGIEGLETVFLSYDCFLADWETELKKSAAGLGIEWPADETGLRAQMAAFVRPDLRHSASGLDELHAVQAPEPVIRLYGLLLELQLGPGALSAVAESPTGTLYQEFLSYARLFDFDMAALADCRSQIEEMATLSEAQPTFVVMENELNSRTQWAWKLDAEVKSLREEAASLRQELAAKTAHSVAPDKELQEVLNSMSWKITKPLRNVHGLLLRLRKGQ